MLRDFAEDMKELFSWLFGAYSPHELDYMRALICVIVILCIVAVFQWWAENEYLEEQEKKSDDNATADRKTGKR